MAIETAQRDPNYFPYVFISQGSPHVPTNIYVDETTHRMLVSGTITGGSAIPATGATTAVSVQIVDGSGNQVTSFGGGTQYTNGGTPPANPVAPTLVFNNAGTWATVGSANPLPVSATLTNPTIGAAVPATGNYIAASKAGTLTGLLLGSQTSANSLSVVLASDQASVLVTATLSAETTKVIGTVRTADGSGNLYTSNSTTYTAKNAQDGNLLGTLGTAFSTAGKVDVKGADGDVFVRSNAASTFPTQATLQTQTDTVMIGGVNIKEINAVTPLMGAGNTGTGSLRVTIASDQASIPVAATLAAETTKVIGTARILGNAGAIVDGVNTAATAPANGVLGLGIYNSTEPSPTTGQSVGLQQDSKGRLRNVIMDAAGNTRGVNVTAGNALSGDITSVAGTAVVNGGLAGSQSVGGTVATNVAITDNPINTGGQAVSSENAAVTTARKVQFVADLVGKQIVLPYANPENFVSGRATATDTTSTSLIAAPAAGLRNYITQITVWNSSSASTYIKIQDGSGGTELYDIPAPGGGGATLTLPTPLRQPTTATAIFFAAAASANAVFVSASGYKGV